MKRQIVIIGAGIVGTSLARELSSRPGLEVTVVDPAPPGVLRGSTGHAPGYVGLFNESAVLTPLAIETAQIYDSLGRGFARSGGIEVATTAAGADELTRRSAIADQQGLPSSALSPGDLARLVPQLVEPDAVTAAVHFPHDGTADARVLTAALRSEAEQSGARFLDGHSVASVRRTSERFHLSLGDDELVADDVVMASGIWGPSVSALFEVELPLFPVAHPYVYSDAVRGLQPGPFVRWPEHHVYARVHGDRIGIGTYDHAPVPVEQGELTHGAELSWDADLLDPAIDRALGLLKEPSHFEPAHRLNGVFAMTPDNLPLAGAHASVPGLWSAQAVWVTHAAGVAAALARLMTGEAASIPELSPDRFAALSIDEQRTRALTLYRDIYANDSAP